jgi:hypothetical protein
MLLGFQLRATYLLSGALPLEPLCQPFFMSAFSFFLKFFVSVVFLCGFVCGVCVCVCVCVRALAIFKIGSHEVFALAGFEPGSY